MTELVIKSEEPPDDVVSDAENIYTLTSAEEVIVEAGPDLNWTIRAEGRLGDDGLSEREARALCDTMKSVIGGTHEEFQPFIEGRNEYLVIVRY